MKTSIIKERDYDKETGKKKRQTTQGQKNSPQTMYSHLRNIEEIAFIKQELNVISITYSREHKRPLGN